MVLLLKVNVLRPLFLRLGQRFKFKITNRKINLHLNFLQVIISFNDVPKINLIINNSNNFIHQDLVPLFPKLGTNKTNRPLETINIASKVLALLIDLSEGIKYFYNK